MVRVMLMARVEAKFTVGVRASAWVKPRIKPRAMTSAGTRTGARVKG